MLYDAYEVQRSLLAGASKLAGLGAGWLNNPANPWGYSSMGPLVAASLEVFAHAAAPRGKPEFGHRQRPCRAARTCRSTRRSCSASRSGSSSISIARASTSGPHLLIVAPMSGHYATLAARHGRAAAAELRRLHHRLARREAGAAVGRQLRSRRLYRLSDRVPGADRQEDRRAAAYAGGLPAGGPGLRRDGADERGQEPLAAEDADDDGRADRHARGADRGQHAGDAAAVQLVRAECRSRPCR